MAKQPENKQTQRPVNRRYVARVKQEADYQRKIITVLGSIVGLIVLIIVVGAIYTYSIEPQQPVAIVGDTEITREDYQKRVWYERYLADLQATLVQNQLASVQEAFAENPELLNNFRQQAQQQLQQLSVERAGASRDALDRLIEEELVVNEAAARGITVTEAEIEEAYNRNAALQVGGYTEAAAQETVVAAQDATATAILFTPTPTLTPPPDATATPEGAEPADTPAPAPTPTINVLSNADLNQARLDWENTMLENAGMTPEDLRQLIRRQLLRQKLIEDFGESLDEEATYTNARHILVNTEEEVQAVVDRLNEGEDFAEVAAEVSIDTGSAQNGGDLGWFGPGRMVEPFEEATMNLEPGQVSDPVETQFGWHIIEVLDREERPMDEQTFNQQSFDLYSDWLSQARLDVQDLWVADDAPAERNPVPQQ